MGSSASKAAGSSSRRFPSRTPGSIPTSPQAPRQPEPRRPEPGQTGPTRSAKPKASTSKTDEIISDSIQPDASPAGFAERLHQMGIVNPTPTFSNSSRAGPERTPSGPPGPGPRYPSPSKNPTLASLESRRRLQERADAEFDALGRRGSPGREFLDVLTISKALAMREKGISAGKIENHLNLKSGVVARLGPAAVAAPLSSPS